MFKVSKRALLLVAGAVWSAAGINIVRIGIEAYGACGPAGRMMIELAAGSVAVYAAFWFMVFSRLLAKHTGRIAGYAEDRHHIWRFFDAKSYAIMAVMMGGGIALRAFGLVPLWFIAFFYTGLGVALLAAGIGFLRNGVRLQLVEAHA